MSMVKTSDEVLIMREGGQKLGAILDALLSLATVGISLLEIEKEAEKRIKESGGLPSFKTVKNYQWCTCLCVNDVVVHGIPTNYVLKEGDVLTIDVGLLYKGLHTDTAWTKIISSNNSNTQVSDFLEKEQFLQAGKDALQNAIQQAKVGNRIGHISTTIQSTIERAGFSIVRSLVGHGVGKQLHEAPQVPNYLRGFIEDTPVLVENMTIAIEPIYAFKKGDIVYSNDDGWTLATKDESLASVFEHTIVITKNGPDVLTLRPSL